MNMMKMTAWEENLMRDFIPIAKPIIGDEEIKAVEMVLKSGMLAQGETSSGLKMNSLSYLGVKNAVAVNNGTVALDLAIKALDLGPQGIERARRPKVVWSERADGSPETRSNSQT